MDVFLIVRRKNQSLFLDVKEETTVSELKEMIAGITKQKPEDMHLAHDDKPLNNDECTMADCNLNQLTCRATGPAVIYLTYRLPSGQFEKVDITPLSVPPELPDAMKPQVEPLPCDIETGRDRERERERDLNRV